MMTSAVAAIVAVVIVSAALSWLLQRRRRVLSLDGAHVVVTGGSEGLGLALCEQLAARGAHVTVVARNAAKLAAACRAIEGRRKRSSQRVAAVACDVTDEAAVARVLGTLPVADVLVANAGVAVPRLFADMSPGEARQMMEVNYFGALNAARALVPGMVKAGSGRVVFVASAMSLTAFAGFSGYCATKWAVRGLAECLQSELRPCGVAVHVYYAPTMKTPGLATENLVKPAVTHELESLGDAVEASEAATMLLAGMDGDRFEITGDAGAELLAMGSLGSPYGNLPLRVLLSPLLALLSATWRWHTRRVAVKHLRPI